jgi:membrane fusion protein (multidrug efflux system)
MENELAEVRRNKSESAPAPTQVAEAPKVKPPASKRRPFVILGVLVGILGLSIGIYALMTAGQEDTDDAQVSSDVVPIGARVAGQVVKVSVKENQLVKKGDLIAEIDDADYAARLKQAEAALATATAQAAAADAQLQVVMATSKGALATAEASYSGSSVGVGSAAAQIAAAHAGLLTAQAAVKKAEIELNRSKELRAANAVPQERLDNAQIAYDTAQAQLAQANAQVTVAQEMKRAAESRVEEAKGRLSQSKPIDAQIAAAKAAADLAHASMKSAEAALELAKLQMAYTKITAPADGLASKLSVHEGQLLPVGGGVIALVPTATYVVANFKETQVGKMKAGQKAEIEIDAFPGKKFEGKVESLSGGTGSSFSLLPADNASGNFVKVVQRVPVRISWVTTPDLPLRAGMSADVTVSVKD